MLRPLLLSILVTSIPAISEAATFFGLGILPGATESRANGISDDGLTVVGITGHASSRQAFRWTPLTGMQGPGSPGSGDVYTIHTFHDVHVSGDGSVIVVNHDGGEFISGATRWTEATGWEFLDPNEFFLAWDVSADGSVIVGQSGRFNAARWNESTGVVLLENSSGHSFADAITPNGETIVGRIAVEGIPSIVDEAFRWTESTGLERLGLIDNNSHPFPTDVSDDGNVIVGMFNFRRGAFRWTQESGYTPIDFPESLGHGGEGVLAVSGDGSIVVGHLWYWDADNGARRLRDVLAHDYDLSSELVGWSQLEPTDITSDGRAIVGIGISPNLQREAWVAYLDSTLNPNPPGHNLLVGAPVTSVELSPGNELTRFVSDGVEYSPDDLISPTLVSFAGVPDNVHFVTPAGSELPEPGARSALLTDDLRLDTGVTNPAIHADAATLEFETPLVNGPGPDLVIFDTGRPSDYGGPFSLPDAFSLSVDGNTAIVPESSWGEILLSSNVDIWWHADGFPATIDELEGGSFRPENATLVVRGLTIDLAELGVGPFEQINSLNFGSFGDTFDPVLFMGINSIPNLPGDYNANGQVEQGDLDLVLLHWGSVEVPDTWLADLPTGAIDQQELDKVLLGWGKTTPTPVNAASVPEPQTGILLLAFAVFGLFVRTFKHALVISALLTCAIINLSSASAAEFIPLGFLLNPPPTTNPRSRALSISDDGLIVSGDTPHPEAVFDVAFRWTRETGMVPLLLENEVHGLTGMSADGSLIGWEEFGKGTRLWLEGEGVLQFDFRFVTPDEPDDAISSDGSVVVGNAQFGPPGSPEGAVRWTRASGVEELGVGDVWQILPSGDGSTIVGTVREASPLNRPPFRWTEASGLVSLGEAPGHNFYSINGISADGSVVIGLSADVAGIEFIYEVPNDLWRWTEESGLTVIDEGTANRSFRERGRDGRWLSSDGSVFVGDIYSLDGTSVNAYRWTEDTGLELLPSIPGHPNSAVQDMSPNGEWIFGQSWDAPFDEREVVPWLWSEATGIINVLEVFQAQGLSPSIEGWEGLWDGIANFGRISADARAIIGSGINPDGYLEAWVAYLDPLVPETLAGDYNNDGTVEQGDLDLVLLHWGSDQVPEAWLNDLPTGAIDQEELDKVLLGWGDTSPVAAATSAVPEPAACLLALVILAASGFIRTHRAELRACALAVVCSFVTIGASSGAEFFSLGNLGPGTSPDQSGPGATTIARDGMTVSGTSPGPLWPGKTGVFRWTKETGMVALHESSLQVGQIPIMSPDGSVVYWEGIDATDTVADTWVWSDRHGLTTVGNRVFGNDPISFDNAIITLGGPSSGSNGSINRWMYDLGFEELFVFPDEEIDRVWDVTVSADGSTVVGNLDLLGNPLKRLPFRWTAEEGMTLLPTLTGQDLYRNLTSSVDGSVFAGTSRSVDPSAPHRLWRWTESEGFVELQEEITDKGFFGVKMSDDGAAIIANTGGGIVNNNAVRWTEETGLEVLQPLPGFTNTTMADTSADGTWILGTSVGSTTVESWLWSGETGMLSVTDILRDQGLSLNIEGWQGLSDLRFPPRLSADGRAIAGTGTNADGKLESWVAYLDPIMPQMNFIGDYNANGQVEQADLDLVLLNWGRNVVPDTWLGDLPTGAIDQEELDKVLLGWGETAVVAAATSAIPEPATALLLAASIAAFAWRQTLVHPRPDAARPRRADV